MVGQLGPFDSLIAVSLTVTVKDTAMVSPTVTVKDTAIKLPISEPTSCVKVEVAVLGFPVPNSPYGLCELPITELGKPETSTDMVSGACDQPVGG